MKINEFIEQYEAKETREEKLDFVRYIIRKEYVPFEAKVAFAQKCMKENITDTKMIQMNTPLNFLTDIMASLEMYTVLEIDPEKPLATYNELQAHGLVDAIIQELNTVPDWREYHTVYRMVSDDFRDNYLSPRGFIQKQVAKLGEYCREQLKELNKNLKELDLSDLKELIKELR